MGSLGSSPGDISYTKLSKFKYPKAHKRKKSKIWDISGTMHCKGGCSIRNIILIQRAGGIYPQPQGVGKDWICGEV